MRPGARSCSTLGEAQVAVPDGRSGGIDNDTMPSSTRKRLQEMPGILGLSPQRGHRRLQGARPEGFKRTVGEPAGRRKAGSVNDDGRRRRGTRISRENSSPMTAACFPDSLMVIRDVFTPSDPGGVARYRGRKRQTVLACRASNNPWLRFITLPMARISTRSG